jgi:endoglucanase
MKCPVLRVPLLPGNYPGAMGRVKTVMDACVKNGIYCIPNWHSFGGADANAASKFYVELATAYGNTANILYEPWNEPTDDNWTNNIKVFHEKVIAAVRPLDKDNIFILGNRQWDQRPDEACADPVTDTINVAYTVHFYANSHKLAGGFQENIEKCLTKNLAIYVTEYGGVGANGNGTFNVDETKKWWDYLDANGIGSTNWAVETNGETSSVFVGNASATGPWTDADLTNSGKIVFAYIASKYDETMAP